MTSFIEILAGLPALLPILLFLAIYFIRVVPANTLIIVDRNTHYLKTKRKGFYFFNPTTDKVTTQISLYPSHKNYSNYFETHDGKIVSVSFSVKYHANNLDDVMYALSSARRSIDDIMESSVYWAVNKLFLRDFLSVPYTLSSEAKTYLLSEATSLCITIDDFSIHYSREIQQPENMNIKVFKPHLSSSHSNGPIKFN